jgi:hypothetical protein
LWHGIAVGDATAVRPADNPAYTWYAFVRFIASVRALQAAASNDTEPTTVYFEAIPGGRRSDYDPNTITAQTMYLRGIDRDGGFDLVQKDQPSPIPGIHAPEDDQELVEMKTDHPDVLVW